MGWANFRRCFDEGRADVGYLAFEADGVEWKRDQLRADQYLDIPWSYWGMKLFGFDVLEDILKTVVYMYNYKIMIMITYLMGK